ncbi:MAG: hypothetical protein HY885_07365 [Deltaproteobacteria bacterium]|nr:hypothetical protein [Deltaproteobacteria bacterium]
MNFKNNRRSIFILIVSLAAYLCGFPGLGNAGTVCFGDDGHVSIKAMGVLSLPLADTSVTDCHSDGENDEHCENRCHSCIDFPLSFRTAIQNVHAGKHEFKNERNPLYPVDRDLPHFSATPANYSPAANQPLLIDSSIIALRTTILLI